MRMSLLIGFRGTIFKFNGFDVLGFMLAAFILGLTVAVIYG